MKLNIGEQFLDDKQFMQIIEQNKILFRNSKDSLATTTLIKHTIEVLPNVMPIRSKPFPMNVASKMILKKEVETLLEKGIIRPSESQFSSPVILVRKKLIPGNDQEYRLCIDYRLLNSITKHIYYQLPLICETINLF